MSTRSAVAVPAGDSWRGRYVHSDGYPTYMLPTLITLIRRDGREKVLQKITEDRYGWSVLDPETTHGSGKDNYLGERGEWEPGYGLAYTTAQSQSAPEEWVTPDDSWGAEWVYVVGQHSIQVLEGREDWVIAGSVDFDISDEELALCAKRMEEAG